jgi:hypothetical protein
MTRSAQRSRRSALAVRISARVASERAPNRTPSCRISSSTLPSVLPSVLPLASPSARPRAYAPHATLDGRQFVESDVIHKGDPEATSAAALACGSHVRQDLLALLVQPGVGRERSCLFSYCPSPRGAAIDVDLACDATLGQHMRRHRADGERGVLPRARRVFSRVEARGREILRSGEGQFAIAAQATRNSGEPVQLRLEPLR